MHFRCVLQKTLFKILKVLMIKLLETLQVMSVQILRKKEPSFLRQTFRNNLQHFSSIFNTHLCLLTTLNLFIHFVIFILQLLNFDVFLIQEWLEFIILLWIFVKNPIGGNLAQLVGLGFQRDSMWVKGLADLRPLRCWQVHLGKTLLQLVKTNWADPILRLQILLVLHF